MRIVLGAIAFTLLSDGGAPAAALRGAMLKRGLLPSAALLFGSMLWIAAGAAQDSNEQAVNAANEAYYAAVSSRSSSRIEQVWAHDTKVTNIFAVNPTPTVGWERVKGAYDNLFARFPKLSVAMREPVIRVEGNAALVVGVESQEAELPNGSTVSAKLPATNVFLKEGDQWRMVHHHTSRPPS